MYMGQHDSELLDQRMALFDLCVRSGLTYLIVAYVKAEQPTDSKDAIVGRNYVLREPVAVQRWIHRRVNVLEKHVNSMSGKSIASFDSMDNELRELSGLRAIAMALLQRLTDASNELSAASHTLHLQSSNSLSHQELLQQTELTRLTSEGIDHLLEILYRIQSIHLVSDCMAWLQEHQLTFEKELYQEFYYQARTTRSSLRQTFEGAYHVALSSISHSDISYPSLLIEMVLQSANVDHQLPLPPTKLSDLFQLFHSSSIQEEIAHYYDPTNEPVEMYFRIQVSLMLYFCLDMSYLHRTKNQNKWTGSELVSYLTNISESFAAQLNVPMDMQHSILAMWLIENAVTVTLIEEEEVASLYQSAVMHLIDAREVQQVSFKAESESEFIALSTSILSSFCGEVDVEGRGCCDRLE